jgi:hypothetical protein
MPPDQRSWTPERLGVVCDCAATPPTIPLYRDPHDHLPTCPVAQWMANQAGVARARETLKDPARASVEMSGLSSGDLADLRAAFGSAEGGGRDV